MQALSLLEHFEAIKLDKRIKRTLSDFSHTAMLGAELALTSLGRSTSSRLGQVEKHGIKRADRLLGTPHLHGQRIEFYKTFSQYFTSQRHPLIHIDWSSVYDVNFAMLRASVAVQGRAFTIYEQVFCEEQNNSQKAHETFLYNLNRVLPADCQPILCTDAGFKVPWFRVIESLGWFWLSRTRGTVKCRLSSSTNWRYVGEFKPTKVGKAQELSTCFLSKAQRFKCRGVIYKGKAKGRKRFNKRGDISVGRVNQSNSKAANEPWFLVSNLPSSKFNHHQIVNLYSKRMTIEESFRDTKNEYYGLGMKRCRSRSIERLEVILLIAMLANFSLLIIGKAAEELGLQRHFQANTVSSYRVLSYITLAKRVLHHSNYVLNRRQIQVALQQLTLESYYE